MEREQAGRQDRLGKYELLERLGHGGMGEVWKARDTQLQRYVAIKLLRAELQDDPDFVASFMREARLVAALRHPNIVQIHDFQLAGASGERVQAYMVMDYIEGGTLADAMRGSVRKGIFWAASDIVDLFTSISLALDYAHQQGMIHRDIKPANILLDRSFSTASALGVPVLTDFGIARWQGGGSTMTGFVGTPLYISPEQAQSRPVDARSDLYSLGIVLYEVLTGTTPFRADNPLAIMFQHVDDQPPPPALINPLISPALSAVVLQSIAKDPRARFSSASAMTIALAQAFNLPVPALLDAAQARRDVPGEYNPLQPRSGGTPILSSFAASGPVVGNSPEFYGHAPAINRMTPTIGEAARQTPAGMVGAQPPVGFSLQSNAYEQTQLTDAPPGSLAPRPARRKWLLVASLGCVVLLLLGLGTAVVLPRLSSLSGTPTPPPGGVSVGQIRFLSNASAGQGILNEVQTDLSNVQSLPAGLVYYAWLRQANSESPTTPHWPLQVQNGIIHYLYTSTLPQTNLLTTSNLFLITAENASIAPVVPNPSPARHYYYATLTQTTASSPTFTVKSCPTSNVNSPNNPCL